MPEFIDAGSPLLEPAAPASVVRLSPFSVLSVIRTLWKRKILILFLWAVGSAMAFAVAALGASSPCTISGAESVAISYPEFFATLESLVQ